MMKFTGTALRLFLLGSLVIVVLTLSIVASTSDEIDVYLCDTPNVMQQCDGPDDESTCANVDGGVDCVLSSCGHQLAKGLDVSVSGASDPLDGDSATATNAGAGFMIFWSLVPYALMLALLASFLFAADTTSLSFAFLLASVAVVNEGIFKHILSKHRPEGSCLYFGSYGMPSGHAATSIGMLTDLLLEIWIARPDTTIRRKTLLSGMAFLFLFPVPFSRVYLHDHFASQVVVGGTIGFVVAIGWFLFMFMFARTRIDNWIDHGCGRWFELRNTYRTEEPWMPAWARKKINNPDIEEGMM